MSSLLRAEKGLLTVGARENKVENYLKDNVELHGGMCMKWVSPGLKGVPDRIVVYQGDVYFVEVKTVDGVLDKTQSRVINRLRFVGAKCFIVYGHEGVDAFIETMVDA